MQPLGAITEAHVDDTFDRNVKGVLCTVQKAAVRALVHSWILDLKDRNIRVHVISPGPVRTPGLVGLDPYQRGAGRPAGSLGQPGADRARGGSRGNQSACRNAVRASISASLKATGLSSADLVATNAYSGCAAS